ncbi:hypothetical protein [Brevibacillus laterosporus]|uniref:hypothetical protein n=1 Tax=Brevibacillus laterosporus TaxID=1465 RepID=UPI001444501B|nr:hypothetical protein [Brevibacillus laterosporus]NKQ22774.1 hypothetical protein [Brevibacillus laterosporus]WNX33768.1 hypothetical protein RWW94_24535 [Brevibacillus laterosporus]
MGRLSRFKIMDLFKNQINEALSEQDKAIFNFTDISRVLDENRHEWRLPISTDTNDFLEFLISKKIVDELEIESPYAKNTKYIFKKNLSVFEVAQSINCGSYLSHYTAVFLHDLTNNIVKNTYVTKEMGNKEKSNSKLELEQKNIDAAFSKPMRVSNTFALYKDHRIFLLNGKFSNNLGIINKNGLYLTNLERTLIDIVVRPDYSGGVFEVLKVFQNAKGKISVNKLAAILKSLDYVYPYHQAIGFYLEKSGYKENVIRLMEKQPIKYDFYLSYNMKNKKYSDRWKLFYPEGL